MHMWGVSIKGNIYHLSGVGGSSGILQNANANSMADSMAVVAVSGHNVWALDHNDHIYYRKGFHSPTWTRVPGLLRQLAVCGSEVWGVNRDGMLYYRDGLKAEWVHVQGRSLKQVSISGFHIWAVDQQGWVLHRSAALGSPWKRVGRRKMKQVSVSRSGNDVWAITQDNMVFYRKGLAGHWKRVSGSMRQVIASGNNVWGLDKDGTIYQRAGTNGVWQKRLHGNFRYLAVSQAQLFKDESTMAYLKRGRFVGCFKDKPAPHRDLPVNKMGFGNCRDACRNYEYYGLQGNECFCGNSYGLHGPTKGCKCSQGLSRQMQSCVFTTSAASTARWYQKHHSVAAASTARWYQKHHSVDAPLSTPVAVAAAVSHGHAAASVVSQEVTGDGHAVATVVSQQTAGRALQPKDHKARVEAVVEDMVAKALAKAKSLALTVPPILNSLKQAGPSQQKTPPQWAPLAPQVTVRVAAVAPTKIPPQWAPQAPQVNVGVAAVAPTKLHSTPGVSQALHSNMAEERGDRPVVAHTARGDENGGAASEKDNRQSGASRALRRKLRRTVHPLASVRRQVYHGRRTRFKPTSPAVETRGWHSADHDRFRSAVRQPLTNKNAGLSGLDSLQATLRSLHATEKDLSMPADQDLPHRQSADWSVFHSPNHRTHHTKIGGLPAAETDLDELSLQSGASSSSSSLEDTLQTLLHTDG